MNLLIPYVHMRDEDDPLLEEFTYGDVRARARRLKALKPGDLAFFHTSVNGKKCITAYFVFERAMDTAMAVKDRAITDKYHNPHIEKYLKKRRAIDPAGDVVMFGNPITSRILDRPLPFGRELASKLSLNIPFPPGRTETQAIVSATRAWRELTSRDVEVLRSAIRTDQRTYRPKPLRSTEEVAETLERDLEEYLAHNPSLIGKGLRLMRQQLPNPSGRSDIVLVDENENLVIVEVKQGHIGRDAVQQLRRYLDKYSGPKNKKPRGILVCAGVLPAYEADLARSREIEILEYGWELRTRQWP